MPMQNSLNVSELLKRLGVVGDSLGSADILDQLRLTINLADLSDLVPPVATPLGGSMSTITSAAGLRNKWALHCRSAGGLRVTNLNTLSSTQQFDIFVADVNPFAGPVATATSNFAFGQAAVSVFFEHTPGAKDSPVGAVIADGRRLHSVEGLNWVGPGQFFCIEARNTGVGSQQMSIIWQELTAALNP